MIRREHAEPIELYCDDDRHARGKVAEVASLVAVEVEGDWSWVAANGRVRGVAVRRPRGTVTRHGRKAGELTHAFPCPLCPRRPALTEANLQTFADGLAAQGITRVSLSVLDRFAAKLGRGEAPQP